MRTRILSLLLLAGMALSCFGQATTTPVMFPMRELTGSDQIRAVTLTPLDGPLSYQGTFWNGGAITVIPKAGGATNSLGQAVSGFTTNLIGGNWRVTFQGLNKAMIEYFPVAMTNFVNAADPLYFRGGIVQIFTIVSTNGAAGGGSGPFDASVITTGVFVDGRLSNNIARLNLINSFTQPNFFQDNTTFRGDTFVSGSKSIGVGKALWFASGHTNALLYTDDAPGGPIYLFAGTNLDNWFAGGSVTAIPVSIKNGIIYANLAGSSNSVAGAPGTYGGATSSAQVTISGGMTSVSSTPILITSNQITSGSVDLSNLSPGSVAYLSNLWFSATVQNYYLRTTGGSATNETLSGTTSVGALTVTNAGSGTAVWMVGLDSSNRMVTNAIPAGGSGGIANAVTNLNGFATNLFMWGSVTLSNALNGDYFFIDSTNHSYGYIEATNSLGVRDVWTNGVHFGIGTNALWVQNLYLQVTNAPVLASDANGKAIAATAGSIPVNLLANTGTPGTYRSLTVNAEGIATAGSNPTTFAGYGISDSSANFAAALTNPNGTGKVLFDQGDGGGLTKLNLSSLTNTPALSLVGNDTGSSAPAKAIPISSLTGVNSTNLTVNPSLQSATGNQTNYTVNLLPGPSGNMATIYPGNTNVFITFTGTNQSDFHRTVRIMAYTNSVVVSVAFASPVHKNLNYVGFVTNGTAKIFNFYNADTTGTNNFASDAGTYAP